MLPLWGSPGPGPGPWRSVSFLSFVLWMVSFKSQQQQQQQQQQLRLTKHVVPRTAGVFYVDRLFETEEASIFIVCTEKLEHGEMKKRAQSGLAPESGSSSVAF